MSILSGIKFIPKSERKDRKKSDDREEKVKTSSKRQKTYDYSSADEDDFHEYRDELALSKDTQKERMGWMTRDEKGNHNAGTLTNPRLKDDVSAAAVEATAINSRNRFKSLLSSAKQSDSNFDLRKVQVVESEGSAEPITSTSAVNAITDNQSMAALLRSKLKCTKGALNITPSESSKIVTRHLIKPTSSSKDSSLKTLVAAERNGGDDMDENLRRNILRMGEKFTTKALGSVGSRAGIDEDEDIDMKLYQRQENPAIFNRGQIMRAVLDDEKLKKSAKNCNCCIDGAKYQHVSNYTIAIAEHTYLRLKPESLRLHPLHCEIVPLQHIASVRQCQEEVMIEVSRFKSCLRRLCEESKLYIIFAEAAVQFSKMPHCSIDCIPVEDDKEVMTSFHDAFLSSGEDFTQQTKLIDLRSDRQLHRAVPAHFEYFCVEWGDFDDRSYGGIVRLSEGFVADDDRYFCLDVVGGMMGEDPMRMRSKFPINREIEQNSIDNFRKQWQRYDWTRYINESRFAD